LQALPRSAVHRILVYNTLDNPIAKLELSGGLDALAREIYLEKKKSPSYIGWPTHFQEKAIVFYDTEGKTHIEDIDRIALIRIASALPPRQTIPTAKALRFVSGPMASDCPDQPSGGADIIYPTRIVSGQIEINKFLNAYRDGFHELERFRSRTVFYARPFLYDQKTKFALQLSNFRYLENRELPSPMPFYFQWGSGGAYGSQGFIALGSKPVEWLPNVEPVFSIRSDVKSSYFTASFLGNPLALSMGKGFMVSNRFFYTGYFLRFDPSSLLVISHFNHATLTGLDWGPFSASAGYQYPVLGIQGNGVFREVLSTHASPIYRLMHTTSNTQLRLIFSPTTLGSNQPQREDIQLIKAQEMQEPANQTPASQELARSLEQFSLHSRFLRAGFDYEWNEELEVGLDQVLLKGSYQEVLATLPYHLDFEHRVTALHIFQQFGNYVALRGHVNWFNLTYRSRFEGRGVSQGYKKFSLTVAIEFVL
ncbi:MAG: hypothetical protein OEW39_14775, partial [Deltaproteobacteria bacterium]|nr:hypothetical protein [Deltaproteobacteria bacterium]